MEVCPVFEKKTKMGPISKSTLKYILKTFPDWKEENLMSVPLNSSHSHEMATNRKSGFFVGEFFTSEM